MTPTEDDGLYSSSRAAVDVVDFVMIRVRPHLADLPGADQILLDIDQKAHHDFGGESVYLSKKPRREVVKEWARRDIQAGKPIESVAVAYNSHPRTIERWLAEPESE